MPSTWFRWVLAAFSVVALLAFAAPATAGEKTETLRVYLGTYTQPGKSEGIYFSDLDLASGKLTAPKLAAKIADPSFLALHPSGKYLYAVSEVGAFKDEKAGAVAAFAIQPDGALEQLNQQSARGQGPCHLVVDPAGKNVLVANYTGGNVAALPIEKDGRLGKATGFVQHKGSSVDKGRQQAPHAHSINTDSAGKFAFAADLGLDKVLIYRLDADKGTLTANYPPAASVAGGAGPRHFAFHPSGKSAYVINEMGNTITAFSYNADKGALTELHTITTLPADFKGKSYTAEVVVHPSGKFVYGSNRGHDSIAVFSVAADTGRLASVDVHSTKGKWPRNFNIDPTGRYLLAANENSDNIVVFRIDQKTGRLEATGNEIALPRPVCIRFLRTAK